MITYAIYFTEGKNGTSYENTKQPFEILFCLVGDIVFPISGFYWYFIIVILISNRSDRILNQKQQHIFLFMCLKSKRRLTTSTTYFIKEKQSMTNTETCVEYIILHLMIESALSQLSGGTEMFYYGSSTAVSKAWISISSNSSNVFYTRWDKINNTIYEKHNIFHWRTKQDMTNMTTCVKYFFLFGWR